MKNADVQSAFLPWLMLRKSWRRAGVKAWKEEKATVPVELNGAVVASTRHHGLDPDAPNAVTTDEPAHARAGQLGLCK
eukprot:5598290-Amphidinium_carterae.1